MKKSTKITTLAVSGVMGVGAIAATIGSIAYFTDTAEVTNTFTVGNVAIDLKEQQRDVDADGNKTTDLVDFVDNQVIYPIVGSAQGAKDAIGMPVAKNYVDKIVTVDNTGNGDAWVRVYFAIRSELDDGFDTFNANNNGLHFNFGTDGTPAANTTYNVSWKWKHDGDNDGVEDEWNYFETEIDGEPYNVYYADYMTKLASGSTTTRAIMGAYLDKEIYIGDNGNLWDKKGGVDYDLGVGADEEIKFPVYSVAIQASGYDSATAAVEGSLGAQYNPWGGTATNWQ